MRGGSESYLIKDSAFYQSKMAAALGVDTVAVYEELRAHVWRSRSRGNGKMRAEVRKGNLSVSIRRQTLADSTGLSVKTVQRRVNLLREVGWVRSENGQPLGGALVYELGHVIQGGMEVFYADMDCREFCLHLEELADQAEEQVYNIPVAERVRLAREWVTREGRGLHRANGGGSQSPTPRVTEAHLPPEGGSQSPSVIENPSGERIEKSEEYIGAAAPVYTGPGPKHLDQPAGQERSERSREKREKERMALSLLLTDKGELGHDDDEERDRLADATKIEGYAKAKYTDQAERDEKRRRDEPKVDTNEVIRNLKEGRTDQVVKGQEKAQKAANLKGGTKYTRAVLREGRDVWDVYSKLVKQWNSAVPVVRWDADGNAKARGQVYRLIDMYGGEATIEAVRYVVGNWGSINTRYFKKVSSLPNFGMLSSMHEPLFREAILWGEHREVMEEWEAWYRENPMKPAPDELKERYEVAQQSLSALGLG